MPEEIATRRVHFGSVSKSVCQGLTIAFKRPILCNTTLRLERAAGGTASEAHYRVIGPTNFFRLNHNIKPTQESPAAISA